MKTVINYHFIKLYRSSFFSKSLKTLLLLFQLQYFIIMNMFWISIVLLPLLFATNSRSTPLPGSSPEQCYCTCATDGKKCNLAPPVVPDFLTSANNRVCKCDTATGTCPDGFEFSGNHNFKNATA